MISDDMKLLNIKVLNRKNLIRSYHRLSKLYHPDIIGKDKDERFINITDAYKRLLKQCIYKTYTIKVKIDEIINKKEVIIDNKIKIKLSFKLLRKDNIININDKRYRIRIRPILDNKDEKILFIKNKVYIGKKVGNV